ncbi:MAG: hypothetical protein IJF50_04230 [Peptococcaceae bacterium]|nr:hypothetical protein [Peptococcaceae bacterium]
MKKSWIVLLLLVMVLLTGCAGDKIEQNKAELYYDENPPQLVPEVAEYYESLGITEEVRKNAEAVYGTYWINDEKEVTIRWPEYWQDLYVIQAGQGITVYDKFNYDLSDSTAGCLWSIYVNTYEEFEWYIESGLYDDPYVDMLGANSAVIGTDDEYVYILILPTDVQFDLEVEHAGEYYGAAMDNKEKFIADFLAVNHITVNEKAPHLN